MTSTSGDHLTLLAVSRRTNLEVVKCLSGCNLCDRRQKVFFSKIKDTEAIWISSPAYYSVPQINHS